MQPTVYQRPQLFDSNGNLIRSGAFGPETPFWNGVGTGVYDYLANNLEFLLGVAEAETIPVATLPASGDTSKTYLVTSGSNAGKCYMWTGSAWQELSSSDVVSRAEEAVIEAESSVADISELLAQVQAYIALATIDSQWNSETTYEFGDCVLTSDGVAYRCLQTSTNNPPASSPSYWALIAANPQIFEYDTNGDIMPSV